MYTEEDFMRDHSIGSGEPIWLPWEKEMIEKLLEEAKKETIISEIWEQIKTFKELYEGKHLSEEVYQERIKNLEQKLREVTGNEISP